jgi:hypothetical protein
MAMFNLHSPQDAAGGSEAGDSIKADEQITSPNDNEEFKDALEEDPLHSHAKETSKSSVVTHSHPPFRVAGSL